MSWPESCERPKVGVCIAAHNARHHIAECLDALYRAAYPNLYIVVVDDGSTDGTWEMLMQEYPAVAALRGGGDLWWTAGNNRSVEVCLAAGCDYVLLLNPDAIVTPDTIPVLVSHAELAPKTIVASLVLDRDRPGLVWWGGSKWGPLAKWLPIWTSRYILKQGTPASQVPPRPYEISEAHGRGVLVPREAFDEVGFYDEEAFPHYGADMDFSLRARRAGFAVILAPQAKVYLDTGSTGMVPASTWSGALRGYWRYLTSRKNGELLTVWWRLLRRHVPGLILVPNYLCVIIWASYRYWTRAFIGARRDLSRRDRSGVSDRFA